MNPKTRPPGNGTPLAFLLGIWLGGSLYMWGVAIYNFSGIEHSFEQNPRLAERAGFDPADEEARKTSLIWVHSSELNRAFFNSWGHVQLLLGVLAILSVCIFRQGPSALLLVLVALLISVYTSFSLNPEITTLGRQLDFVPRDPPPPVLAEFNEKHAHSRVVDTVRVLAIFLAAVVVMARARTRPADSYLSTAVKEDTIESSVEDSIATRGRVEESPDSEERGGG